jgi:GNAT superfamily N-acetyltransferase
MAVITRLATPDDAEQLIAHVQRLLHEPDRDVPLEPGEFTLTVEQERQALAEYAATPNAVFLVAEADGAIVGELNCKGSPRQALRHAVTLGISVRQEWRGQGVGSQLMDRRGRVGTADGYSEADRAVCVRPQRRGDPPVRKVRIRRRGSPAPRDLPARRIPGRSDYGAATVGPLIPNCRL